MTLTNQHRRTDPANSKHIDLFSVALLFVALVIVGLMLVGIAVRGTSPWILIAPTILGCTAILTIRRK